MSTPVVPQSLSSSQVSALLSLGLTHRAVDPAQISRALLSEATARRADALPLVLADLQSPVAADAPGPLSLARLLELEPDQIALFSDRTFLGLLTLPSPPRAALDLLLRYGELLQDDLFPDPTRLTGSVIRCISLLALKTHHAFKLSSADHATLETLQEFLSRHPEMSKSISHHLGRST